MSDKKLTLLGVLAAASIIAAVLISQVSHRTKPAAATQGNLIQGLDPANIAEIKIGRGKDEIDLKRTGRNFVIVNKSNYPASNRAINDLLASCLDVRIVELYATQEKNFKELGVTEENAASVVKFLDKDGKIITGLIIGLIREKDGMAYGRLINGKQVYVIYNMPSIAQSPINYAEQELVSVDKGNIEEVIVSSPKTSYTLVGEANGTEAVLKELPAGKKEKKQQCEMVFNAMANLNFEDVNSAEEMSYLDFNRRYHCRLKDSTLYTIEIAEDSGKYFAKCDADFLDKQQGAKEAEPQEELKTKLLAREKAVKFKSACQGWVYNLPQRGAKNMVMPITELVEDVNSRPDAANSKLNIKNQK